MAKINITVDLDWIDEAYNLDDEVKSTIINGVVEKVQNNLTQQIENECNAKISEQLASIEKKISDKLNALMDDFFDTPRDITDKYGDVVKKGITVKQTLKEACDNFLNQPLDEKGKPTSEYFVKYKTRVDYIVANSIGHDMQFAIQKAVDEVTKNLKERVSNEVKKQIGEKLAGILDIDTILTNKKQ